VGRGCPRLVERRPGSFGDGNTAIASGDNSSASAFDGDGNTATAIGDNSYAAAGVGDGNTATASGNGSVASVGDGDGNTGSASGNGSHASVGPGDGNTATASGDNSYADASFGDGNTATASGDNSLAFAQTGDNNTATTSGNGRRPPREAGTATPPPQTPTAAWSWYSTSRDKRPAARSTEERGMRKRLIGVGLPTGAAAFLVRAAKRPYADAGEDHVVAQEFFRDWR
jgi:hypothetical protein